MSNKFEGTIEELQVLIEAAGLKGDWEDDGQGKHTFRSRDGGVLNWWPLITPTSEGQHWPHSIQLLYLFLDGIPLGFVCVILFFINQPSYAVYTNAPHLWGISALADFQLGAIILYGPGLLLDIVVLSIIFFKWLARQEEVARLREEAEDAAEEAELAQRPQASTQA